MVSIYLLINMLNIGSVNDNKQRQALSTLVPKPVNPVLGQYHGCCCPGSLFSQVISSHACYSISRIKVHSSSMRKDFNYLCDLSVERWQQTQKYFNASSKQFGILYKSLMTIQPYFCKNFRIFDSDLTSRPASAGLRPPRRINSWKTLTTTSGVLIRIRSWNKKIWWHSQDGQSRMQYIHVHSYFEAM